MEICGSSLSGAVSRRVSERSSLVVEGLLLSVMLSCGSTLEVVSRGMLEEDSVEEVVTSSLSLVMEEWISPASSLSLLVVVF